MGFEPTTPGLKGPSAFLSASQRQLATKSADFERPRYVIFARSGSAIGATLTIGFLAGLEAREVHGWREHISSFWLTHKGAIESYKRFMDLPT